MCVFYIDWTVCVLQLVTATVTRLTVTMTPRWIRGEAASTRMDTTEEAESALTVR